MSPTAIILASAAALFLSLFALTAAAIRRRHMQLWLGTYLQTELTRYARGRRRRDPVHVLLCIADHFEPHWGGASQEVAAGRVEAWLRRFPEQFGRFRDSDGRPPRHTFFYPVDQYHAGHVEAIAGLCREGYGEMELHLHHDNDTAENLERTLQFWTERFAHRHGVLGRWPDGRIAYGFVHGNWALDNSRPDGRWCGVRNELDVLHRTGCYADFTLPSAPDATQTLTINSIYYATGDACRCKGHDTGVHVGTAPQPPGSLMLIQGPLGLWRRGLFPKIENGCIQASQPPSMERLDRWIRTGVGVPSRPDWVFIKLHTHGATESNQRVLLGEPMARFHAALAQRAAADPGFHFHYVTAREMYNLVKAAEAGYTGPVAGAFHRPEGVRGPNNAADRDFLARSLKSPSPEVPANR